MKNILSLAIMLLFSVSAYAQPNAKKNLYLIDAAGNVLELAAPSLTGSISITMPTEGGTLITNTSSTPQTVTGGMSITGGLNVQAGGSLKWFEPVGANFTAFVAQSQASDITYTLPATLGSANDVLALTSVNSGAGTATLGWVAPTGSSTFATGITVGDNATPTVGTITVEDADNATSHQATIKGAAAFTNDFDYTLPALGASGFFAMTSDNTITAGDLLVGAANNVFGTLAKGANNTTLTISNTGVIAWTAGVPYDNSDVSITGGTVTANLRVKGNNGNHYGLLKQDGTVTVDHKVGNDFFQWNFDGANTGSGNKTVKFLTSSVGADKTRSFTLPDTSGTIMLTNTPITSLKATSDAPGTGAVPGTVYISNQTVAWGAVTGATGALTASFGSPSVSRTAAGTYTITLQANSAVADGICMVTVRGVANAKMYSINKTSSTAFTVYTLAYNNGQATDSDFDFMIIGRP